MPSASFRRSEVVAACGAPAARSMGHGGDAGARGFVVGVGGGAGSAPLRHWGGGAVRVVNAGQGDETTGREVGLAFVVLT